MSYSTLSELLNCELWSPDFPTPESRLRTPRLWTPRLRTLDYATLDYTTQDYTTSMASIKRFEEIHAWQLARQLTGRVYAITKRPPFDQDWGLKNQIRAASGSTMHNIAEGFDAGSDAEFARFLRYTRRSATEVQSELYAAFDQQYISNQEFTELYDLAEQCKKATNGLIQYLSPKSGSPKSGSL